MEIEERGRRAEDEGESGVGQQVGGGYGPPVPRRTPGWAPLTEASWEEGAFDRNAVTALWATAITGALVAVAPAIPRILRVVLLAFACLIWFALVLRASLAAARAGARLWASGARAAVLLTVVGIGVALLLGAQLELVRVLTGHHALTWNIDWRHALSDAQTVARYGGTDHALDYAGAPVGAPIGPAWLAGSVQKLFGFGLGIVLLGVIPALYVAVVVIAGMRLLASYGIAYRHGAVAVALALALPFSEYTIPTIVRALPAGLENPTSWRFLASALPLASMLALAVGMSSLALLLAAPGKRGALIAGAVGLASLAELQPEYLAGFGLAALLLAARSGRGAASEAGEEHGHAATVAIVGALVAGALLLVFFPPGIRVFGAPRLLPGAVRGRWHEPLRLTTAVAIVAAIVWWTGRTRGVDVWARTGWALVASLLGAFALSFALHVTIFPARPLAVANSRALGLGDPQRSITATMAHALEPLHLLVLIAALAVIVLAAARAPRPWRLVATIAGALLALSPVPLLVRGFVSPPAQYAAAEDPALRAVLDSITPRDRVLLVSSDLADPGNDYLRSMRNSLLTAYDAKAFYVSNVGVVHYARPGVVQRVREVRAFFGAPWSPWHDAWAARHGITHVLVHDRCPPAWLATPGLPLRVVMRDGAWTGYAIERRDTTASSTPPSSFTDPVPTYGKGGCLLGVSEWASPAVSQ